MTNFSGNLSPQQKVNVACKGPRGGGMDRRRNQVTNQTIPEGFKQTEIGVVPEDWDVVFINDVSTLIGDGIHSTPIYDPNGAYYFINGNNIDNGSLRFTENTNRVSEAEFNKHKKKINDRTLLLSINGTIGNLCFYNNEPIILGKSAAYININHKAEVRYMYQAISFDATQQRFEDGLTGSTIKNLGLGTIKSTLIGLPSKKEQTAIANALSDMDALLSELEKLIAKKQAMKTATMQQLLTGKTRLPQFAYYSDINSTEGAVDGKRKGTKPSELGEIPEDWEVKQVKEVCGFIVPGRNKPRSFSGNIPWVTTSDIDSFKSIDMSKVSLYVSREEAIFIGSKVVPKNAVIMSCVGELGIVAVVEDEIVINQQLHAFIPSNAVCSRYLAYTLTSLKEHFYSKATKTTLPYLNKDNCNSTPIALPTKNEQTAIATILSDMDNEIQTLEQRLSKTRQIKQGMMQELLTGKTRLPFEKTNEQGVLS
ncbi:EcoKI restriction-modification system protein HsdS [Shewanella baltica]|uniref:restriction endonuclease subunit S n=1 Tax=Shewanella TaxID=22 RepID=UPI000F6B736B|nr:MULTISPECIES: restriction endonuclease subunit S [Shewanella]WAL77053.1 restriction endonuclease subunit S [Shewanella sp. DAU305]VEF26142.1 EcoKI restriction-modification system protein HsdS [Shewanella baltica]